jgi:integrase
LPPDLLRRIRELPPRIRESLERFGLVSDQFDLTLQRLCKRYQETKTNCKEKTVRHYCQWSNRLYEFFGKDAKVSVVTKKEAEKFLDCISDHLSPCTVFRGTITCRAIFRYAVGLGTIFSSPFEGVRRGQRTNESRQFYVSRDMIDKVLSACADDRERLVVVLARYGGLRIPSEIERLTFGDFTETRFHIHEDTKTGAREVPLFHEIREVFERLSGSSSERIFTGKLSKSWGAWTMLADILERVGLDRWPKLFVNLRSSSITDLVKLGYDERTLDAIFGNSAEVRKAHYIQLQKDKEYKKVLEDNAAIVEFLRKNGGTFEMGKKEISLRDILDFRDLLVSRFESEKTGT